MSGCQQPTIEQGDPEWPACKELQSPFDNERAGDDDDAEVRRAVTDIVTSEETIGGHCSEGPGCEGNYRSKAQTIVWVTGSKKKQDTDERGSQGQAIQQCQNRSLDCIHPLRT